MNRCNRTDAQPCPNANDQTDGHPGHDDVNPSVTLDAIADLLSAAESSDHTLDLIANLIRATGRSTQRGGCEEEQQPPPGLDEDAMSLIMNGALGSDDVELLPTAPTRGGDDGWWVEVRVWVSDSLDY